MDAVSRSCETEAKIIMGSKRTKKASYARDISAYIMHLTGHSHEDISKTFNRDRSSVTHMIKRVRTRIGEASNHGRMLRERIKYILDTGLDMGFIDIDE